MAKVVINSPTVPKEPEVEQPKVEPVDTEPVPTPPDDSGIAKPEMKKPYSPETDAQKSIPFRYKVIGIILLAAVIILGVMLSSRPTDLPVSIQEFAVESSEDGTSFVVLLKDTNHSRIDVYRDNVLINMKGDQVKDGVRFDDVDPGIYVVHVVTVNNSSVEYGLVQLNLLAASRYSGLSAAVADYVSSIKDDKQKFEHCTALVANFEKHANMKDVSDVETLLKSLNAETVKILGFNDVPPKLENEAEWYNLIKPNGIITTYMATHNMFITMSNYKSVLKAIALGIQEGAK